MPSCYNGFIKLENINLEEINTYMQLFNVGINPI